MVSLELKSLTDKFISKYADELESKFKIPKNKTIEIWNTGTIVKKSTSKKREVNTNTAKCEHKYGKTSKNPGKICEAKVANESTTGKYCKKHLGNEKEGKKKKDDGTIVKSLNNSKPLQVAKNKFGNYEDKSTHFVFDPVNKCVIGKQVEDKVETLSEPDIELCKSLNYKYELPKTIKTDYKENDGKELMKKLVDDEPSDEESSESDNED